MFPRIDALFQISLLLGRSRFLTTGSLPGGGDVHVPPEVMDLIRRLDLDGNSTIDYDEFVAAAVNNSIFLRVRSMLSLPLVPFSSSLLCWGSFSDRFSLVSFLQFFSCLF